MPELNSITVYVNMDRTNLKPVKSKLKTLLSNISYSDAGFEPKVDRLKPIIEDDGFGYFYSSELNFGTTSVSPLLVKPDLMLWTAGLSKAFRSDWMSVELAFYTIDLIDQESRKFTKEAFEAVSGLCQEVAAVFEDRAVYFTDDWHDTPDFYSGEKSVSSYDFDLAYFPSSYAAKAQDLPEGFEKLDAVSGFFLLKKAKWDR